MAVPTNTFETFDSNSMKESFEDIIYSIAPSDTPFMSGIGKTNITNTTHEWSVDALADAGNYGDGQTFESKSDKCKSSNRIWNR